MGGDGPARGWLDLGWLGNGGEVHINVTAAQTRLNGPGTSPVELLGVNPSAQFTAPNLIKNKYTQVNLSGSYDINDTTSLQGLVYYTYLLQKVYNGNVPDLSPCNNGSGLLCEAPGVVGTGLNGNPIPDFMSGGPYSDLDQQSTNTNGYGVSFQLTNRDELFVRPNQFIAGFSFGGAQTLFSASTQIGGLSLSVGCSSVPESPSIKPTDRSRRCASASPTLTTALSLPIPSTSPRSFQAT
jgi:iron complex outermembrane receptor protein